MLCSTIITFFSEAIHKQQQHNADNSHLPITEGKNEWRYISISPYTIMAFRSFDAPRISRKSAHDRARLSAVHSDRLYASRITPEPL